MSYFAINYFHSIVRHQNPCLQNPSQSKTNLCYNVLEGIKRILAYSVTKKPPVTVSQLYEMYNYFGSKAISLSNFWTILICFIFYGFSKISWSCKIETLCNHKTFLSIFIEKSKTDVYREGSWAYLKKLDTVLCPIELVSQYFKKGNIKDNCQIFLGALSPRNHIQN